MDEIFLNRFNYLRNQFEALTDGRAYGYSIQIHCNANGDSTTWMNISKEQLEKIKAIFQDDTFSILDMLKELDD